MLLRRNHIPGQQSKIETDYPVRGRKLILVSKDFSEVFSDEIETDYPVRGRKLHEFLHGFWKFHLIETDYPVRGRKLNNLVILDIILKIETDYPVRGRKRLHVIATKHNHVFTGLRLTTP